MTQIPILPLQNPRHLFWVDGLGALLSAFLLGIVWVEWQGYFGLPTLYLYVLAILPLFFVAYDVFALFNRSVALSRLLYGISFLNLAYVITSILISILHFEVLTIWANLYLGGEILIVLFLSSIEYVVASKLKSKRT